MKLSFPEVKIERSTAFESQGFDIGNKRIILEILRGKMYSNPIQTICQEIMSNARDAHREVGKHNIPIEVKVPSKLEPTFWIRDFGPGITPSRMADVFIRYGNSTKRDDNTQTGGFGLGSKSPFSYSDTFTITSITPENGKMVKRQYLAHIDESGLGQMSCALEVETEEAQGTTVAITPKPNDFESFKKYVKQTATHWDVRPTVLGDLDWQWPTYDVAFKGDSWEIHHNSPAGNAPLGLIDGIPYRLNLNHIFPAGLRADFRELFHIPLRLFFKVGEVPVTANREDLDYQPGVVRYLQQRIESAIDQLKKQLAVDLEKQPDLLKAIALVQDLRHRPYGSFLTNLKWKDIDIARRERFELNRADGIFVSIYRRDPHTKAGCRKQSEGRSQRNPTTLLRKDVLIVEDDTGKKVTSCARLASIFDRNPDVHVLVVVNFSLEEKSFTDPNTKETIYTTVTASEKTAKDRVEKLEKAMNWSLYAPIKLSTVPKKRVVVDPNKSPTVKKVTYKIKKLSKDAWLPAEPADYAQLTEKIYLAVSGSTIFFNLRTDQKISFRELGPLFKDLETLCIKVPTIFGVIPSHTEQLDKTWKPLHQFVSEIYEQKKVLVNRDTDTPHSAHYTLQISGHLFKPEFLTKLSETSSLRIYLEKSKKLTSDKQIFNAVNNLGNRLLQKPIEPKDTDEFKDLFNEVSRKYPLLFTIQNYRLASEALDDLAAYVSIKDTKDSAK